MRSSASWTTPSRAAGRVLFDRHRHRGRLPRGRARRLASGLPSSPAFPPPSARPDRSPRRRCSCCWRRYRCGSRRQGCRRPLMALRASVAAPPATGAPLPCALLRQARHHDRQVSRRLRRREHVEVARRLGHLAAVDDARDCRSRAIRWRRTLWLSGTVRRIDAVA